MEPLGTLHMQFPTMKMGYLLKNTMKVGSIQESKTYIENTGGMFQGGLDLRS